MDGDLTALRRAAESAPDDAVAWLRLAQALFRVGQPHGALAATRRALRAAPRRLECEQLLRRAFLEARRRIAEPELRRLIGEALGLGVPYPDPDGWTSFSLLAGNFDATTRTVAWVEKRRRPHATSPGFEVQVELRAVRGGREVLTWVLRDYKTAKGIHVLHLHVEEEQAVVAYRGWRQTIAAVLPFNGEPSSAVLRDAEDVLVLPDRVLFHDFRERHVIRVRTLPDFEHCTPLHVPGETEGGVLRVVDDDLVVPLKTGGHVRIPLGPA